MSALGRKVLDLAEQQGLLDGKAIKELRAKVAESKFVVTPEAIAKVLVDSGHLTAFQARKLVSQAQGNEPDPAEQRAAERARARAKTTPMEDLRLAEDDDEPYRKQPDAGDVVELEAIDPAPSGKNAPGKSYKKPLPAALESRDEGATAEDFVELEPVRTAPAPRGQRWKSDPPPLNETVELSPLDMLPGAGALQPDVAPIDDLFGTEPFTPAKPAASGARAAKTPAPPPVDLLAEPPAKPSKKPKEKVQRAPVVNRPLKNVWDSPLLLIGGGLLGVIVVAFAILLYALTRGTAAELFNKAEEEYRGGSLASAAAVYDKFLERYPGDANASLARVRRGMATLRQITDDGKNPRLSLETAQQILPQIEKEEKFGEARGELSSILPDIADGVVTRAAQAAESPKKQEWVELAGQALALVNNPAYLPASLRKERESQISRIVDKLKVAERGIQEDKELASTIEKIAAAAEKGQAAAGYQLRTELLRTYPALAGDAGLVAAIRKVGEKERELVKVSQGGPAPFTTDHPAGSETVVLSAHDGPSNSAAAAKPVFILLEGAVYGLDAASGRVLWRRLVGYQTTVRPAVITVDGVRAAVLFDGRHQELTLVEGTTGRFRWRQKLADEAVGMVTVGSRVFVTTRKGQILSIESGSGEIVSTAQLPQGATVGPAVRQGRMFQLGEHSTLFVLEADLLRCTETVYLGHAAGAIFVPPAAVLEQLVFAESPADDYSLVSVLAIDAKSKKWQVVGQPRRMKGRVVTPLAVSGSRVAVATDLGQVAVLQIETAGGEPLRSIAGLAASESTPLVMQVQMERNRLWVAGRRRTMYEVQESLNQLTLRWTENQDDRFLAPLELDGEVIVSARRRGGVDAVLVEGVNATSGETLWTTRLAAPVIGLVPDAGVQIVTALTGAGHIYLVENSSWKDGAIEEPAFRTDTKSFTEASLSSDGSLVWNRPHASEVHVYDVSQAGAPGVVALPAQAAAAVAVSGAHLIAPLVDGRVAALPIFGKSGKIGPFLPPLAPGALPLWAKPAPLTGGKSFLVSDGRETVYAVGLKEQPQPHLAEIGKVRTSGAVTSLVTVGAIAMGVLQQESSDAVVGFDERGAAAFEPVALAGRIEAGPFVVGGLALFAAVPDGLVCITGEGRVRWKQQMVRGPLAGAPVALADGDVLVAYQSGDVCRIDAASGAELACRKTGQPLSGPMCVMDSHVFLSGSDGVVQRIETPKRSERT